MIFSQCFVEIISLPQKDVFRGVFLANHSASTVNLTKTTTRQNTYKRKLMTHRKVNVINSKTHSENLW